MGPDREFHSFILQTIIEIPLQMLNISNSTHGTQKWWGVVEFDVVASIAPEMSKCAKWRFRPISHRSRRTWLSPLGRLLVMMLGRNFTRLML
jgi:hypothetical protein